MTKPSDDELAGEYVLGTLEAEARDAARRRAVEDRAFGSLVRAWEDRLAPLALLESVEPPPGLFDRIEKAITASGLDLPGTVTSRAKGAVWEQVLPGLEKRTLHRDEEARRQTILVRMRPGAIYPQHGHDDQDEEIFILEGDLVIGGLVLEAGDFHLARADRLHPAHTTRQGCVCLINQGF